MKVSTDEIKKTTEFEGRRETTEKDFQFNTDVDFNIHSSSPTVLPDQAAKMVTYVAQGGTVALRLGIYFAETTLETARVSILSTLGVSRRILENILSKADEDTPRATKWAVACMQFVDDAATLAHFATSAYFHLSNSLVNTVSYLWLDSIHIANSVFGSTDSSRAIAAILSLIRRELGDGAGVYALATTLVFFSIVQARSWKRTLEGIEMIVLWDVVVLESGETLAQQQMPDSRNTREYEDEGIIKKTPNGAKYIITSDQYQSENVTVEVSTEAEILRDRVWPPEITIPAGAEITKKESRTIRSGGQNILTYTLSFEKSTRRFRERKGTVSSHSESSSANAQTLNPLDNEAQDDIYVYEEVETQPANCPTSPQSSIESATSSKLKSSSSMEPLNIDQGEFPLGHLTYNMAKFCRYASASYGHSFMKLLGIGWSPISFPTNGEDNTNHHAEHYAFAHHTRLLLDQILLSSYTDIAVDDTSGIPLVHFVAVDHESKAVVLTIRGTLGLEDILTDLTCEYADFEWHGKSWTAHGGMLKCAKLLTRSSSRVLQTIANALRRLGPEYGLILCGHSLGGGVAALLGILLSEAAPSKENQDPIFVTSRKTILPARRRVKVFTYGPPASICNKLRLATKSLIISVVYGLDVVPCLSLGLFRDFQSLAHALKNDDKGVVEEIRRRLFGQIPIRGPLAQQPEQDDYLFSIMTALRYVMQNEKLVPPGDVYHINTTTVFETQDGHTKKATRVIGSLVVDVEQRFREPVFGREIFHHSPAYYEKALDTLESGVSQAPI